MLVATFGSYAESYLRPAFVIQLVDFLHTCQAGSAVNLTLPVITLKQNTEVAVKLHFTAHSDPVQGIYIYIYIYIYLFLQEGPVSSGPDPPYYRGFTKTFGRNPLDE